MTCMAHPGANAAADGDAQDTADDVSNAAVHQQLKDVMEQVQLDLTGTLVHMYFAQSNWFLCTTYQRVRGVRIGLVSQRGYTQHV